MCAEVNNFTHYIQKSRHESTVGGQLTSQQTATQTRWLFSVWLLQVRSSDVVILLVSANASTATCIQWIRRKHHNLTSVKTTIQHDVQIVLTPLRNTNSILGTSQRWRTTYQSGYHKWSWRWWSCRMTRRSVQVPAVSVTLADHTRRRWRHGYSHCLDARTTPARSHDTPQILRQNAISHKSKS